MHEGREAPKVDLFGLRFERSSLLETAKRLIAAGLAREKLLVFTANVDHVVSRHRTPEIKRLYQKADIVVADGMPIVWTSKLARGPSLPERVTGVDLVVEIAAQAATVGLRCFFLGGRPGAAETAGTRLSQDHRGFALAGWYCPPLGFENDPTENEKIVSLIDQANPHVLMVGLGFPKQEHWVVENAGSLTAGPILCIGGSFDLISGQLKRAPRWLQRAGFEWLWRLAREPRRLWRRYLVNDPLFVALATREVARSWFARAGSPKNPAS